MTDKVQKIREEVKKLHGNPYYMMAVKDALAIIDSLQEEIKTDWLQELQEKLDSLSKEDFKKVWAKYSRYGEEGSVDYDKLNTMLDDALSKETKESWNEWLDKKDFRERYKRIAQSELFKKAYEGISIGDAVSVEGEETVSRTPADIEAAMQEVEEKSKAFTAAHHGEDTDTILAQMRGEEPISKDLEEASKEWLRPKLDKSYANYGETKMMELTHFDGYAMLDAIEFGAKWLFEKVEEALLSEVLPCFMHGGEADEVVAKLEEVLNKKK